MAKTDISIGDLVSMIQKGELQLPEMQRRYVWTSTRVRDLLDSLYRNYPSGTILVWESNAAQPTREMAVQTQRNPWSATKLLLDGQQRLTSLSAVLRGEPISVRNRKRPVDIAFNLDHPDGPPVDLQEIEDDKDNPIASDISASPDDEPDESERIESVLDRLSRRAFAVSFNALFTRPSWIRVSEVFKGEKADWDFIKPLVSSPDDPKYRIYADRLIKLRRIKDYQYVMQVLPREMSYEEVAEIFVRVNSLGAKLRGSDLALAQITARWRNSLKLFEDYVDECEAHWFTIDTGLLVRSIVVFATKQSRFKTVGSIPLEEMKEGWKKAKLGLDFAINFLRTNAGIEDESLLSSPLILIPVAVFGALHQQGISLDQQKEMLKWIYLANSRGWYSTSSESTLDADLAILFRGGSFAELIPLISQRYGRLHVEPIDFKGRGERSPLFSITFLALKHAGAMDWNTGLGLSLKHQGNLHYIEYHHIFPRAVLREGDFEKSEINEIANMAFISGKINRAISSKPPSIYLPTIIEKRGLDSLKSQAIPVEQTLWQMDHYRNFLELRRQYLAQAVNEFINASVAKGQAAAIKLP